VYANTGHTESSPIDHIQPVTVVHMMKMKTQNASHPCTSAQASEMDCTWNGYNKPSSTLIKFTPYHDNFTRYKLQKKYELPAIWIIIKATNRAITT
jgi:hypothetical protein